MNKLEIIYLQEAHDYLKKMPEKANRKMVSVIDQVRNGSRDPRLFKKLEETEIWEFRAEYESNAYRLLAFWDKGKKSLVVATHGFNKKVQKTPKKEISKAERIREEYLKSQNKQ